MPDFNHLADQLRTDLSHTDWPDADLIRAAGNRRARTQRALTTTTVVVVVAVVAVLLLTHPTLPHHGNIAVGPAASQSQRPHTPTTPPPTPTTPTTPGQPTRPVEQGTIPPGALLTTADLTPTFTGLNSPYTQPYSPNPFLGCGPDGLPGTRPFTDVVGAGFTGDGSLHGGESILLFAPGAAHQTMTAISQLTAGTCAVPFQILRRDLGGDESLLITSSDPSTVTAQAAHGIALYYGIERRGDYLIWVTLIDQTHKTGQANLAATLTTHAAQQLCTTVMC